MGNNFSGTSLWEAEGEVPSNIPKLDDIPECCLAMVLTHMEPPEICKLARLNRAFRNASSADFIWELKLPANYRFLLQKLAIDDAQKMAELCKKDVYARLCKPNPFDGGKKELWLDKRTGGVCLSISSKALRITGIDDRRHWNHIPTDESRFQTVAYLQQAWWVEVDGELEFNFPAGTYSLFFRLHVGRSSKKLGRRVCSSEHVHGWDVKPVKFELGTSGGQHAVSQCFLDSPGSWVNHHVGDFVVDRPNEGTKIKFSLTQIDCTHTKGGLCVDSVIVCPRGVDCLISKMHKFL